MTNIIPFTGPFRKPLRSDEFLIAQNGPEIPRKVKQQAMGYGSQVPSWVKEDAGLNRDVTSLMVKGWQVDFFNRSITCKHAYVLDKEPMSLDDALQIQVWVDARRAG